MDSKTIRRQFIEYFEKTLGHTVVSSAPVIPQNDPTLLFTNAGMNQFKPYFLGEAQAPFKRVVDSQKCIRVSGKHNDLEAVGRDHYHHTFFEMLGSWSFGDYYKKEAINWAWTLFTEVWGLDPKRLYATVFTEDDEAYKIWENIPNLDSTHLLKAGKKDNFWSMGDTGPCGPCSEIHYYSGNDIENQDPLKVNADDPKYMELWNLVFIQFNRDKNGELHTLDQKHIDTGAGFERIVAVINGKQSNYDTDLFKPIIEQIEIISGIAYTQDNEGIPHRVIADHIRMLSVAIADGAIPGNEGRAYVLRRILRRAARFGRELNLKEPFLYRLVPAVAHILGDVYPEIKNQREHIQRIIRAEEESFGNTLDKGLDLFDQIAKQAKKCAEKTLNSKDVFKLYDTFGFPVDLTRLLAEEKDLLVNEEEVNRLMDEQRARARAAGKFSMKGSTELTWIVLEKDQNSKFVGYDTYTTESLLLKYAVDDSHTYLVFDKTPFYAESGGQVGDKGQLILHKHNINTDARINVIDTKKIGNDIVHIVEGSVLEGNKKPITATLEVQQSIRRDTARNHTATHLLHAELRAILGDHVHQAGSYVGPDRLRFDFTHFEKVSMEQRIDIQQRINTRIMQNTPVVTDIKPYTEAIRDGAQALFGEKYGDEVRVVSINEMSKELCGGTHVERSGDIGPFIIVAENSVASGVRRIEAITGSTALDILKIQQTVIMKLRDAIKLPEEEIADKVISMSNYVRTLEKENSELKSKLLTLDIDIYFQNERNIDGKSLFVNRVDVENIDQLKAIGDKVREKMKSGIAVFGAVIKNTPQVLCVVTDDLVKEGIKAGNIVKSLGKAMGGGGGGKPHMATAGGKDVDGLDKVLENIESLISR
ncbi:MAG: alanine--tRNA ligase [Candidatus Neomarinimicrobiota bacterium]|nr:MAG: alanine--tRNA ligase [Candidatus Neomarinimicrobiota bacterium]